MADNKLQSKELEKSDTVHFPLEARVMQTVPTAIRLYNCDCMEYMDELEDNAFDLAIVDPPYGIEADNMTMGKGKNKKWNKGKDWDSQSPGQDYFDEIYRVSKKQIIWGANYFNLQPTGGMIFWDKLRGKDISFSDGEIAWTNFLNVIKKAPIRYDGFIGADKMRIHPTQKPVALYRWLLQNYANKGDKILDTHLGSGSIAIACDMEGFELTGCEIDEDYFEASIERLNEYKKQTKIQFA